MSEFVTVAELEKIPLVHGLMVRVADREIALFMVDGAVHALDAQCPHKGGPLWAGIIEGGQVYCPLHGWGFDLKTGMCRDHPDRPVECYPVRVVEGQVQIQI